MHFNNSQKFNKTMFTKSFLKATLLGVVVLIAACNSTPTIDEMTVRMRKTDEVKILDLRSVKVNNLLKAEATILVKSTNKTISYRFMWIDKNSFQLYGDEAWKPLPVGSGQSGVLTGIAPGPGAETFKLELSSD